MTKGIALGQTRTIFEAKEKIANHKERLAYIIKSNKLKCKPSQFKFSIDKEEKNYFGDKNAYPYYCYVDTPSDKYNWIFII